MGKIYKKEGFISPKLCEILVFKKYFKMENIIKTEMFHSALSMQDVVTYLNKESNLKIER